MKLGRLPKGPLDPALVLEGDLWNGVSEGEYNVTAWEPARRYRVVSADS